MGEIQSPVFGQFAISINISVGEERTRGARYGVMSGLISWLCLRLINKIPLGREKTQKRRREKEKATERSASYHLALALFSNARSVETLILGVPGSLEDV